MPWHTDSDYGLHVWEGPRRCRNGYNGPRYPTWNALYSFPCENGSGTIVIRAGWTPIEAVARVLEEAADGCCCWGCAHKAGEAWRKLAPAGGLRLVGGTA